MTSTFGKEVTRPDSNAALVKLVGHAYWKATGEAFHPDKKVVQDVLRAIHQSYRLFERVERLVEAAEPAAPEVRADGQLTSRDFDGLSVEDLRLLLQRQQATKSKCDDAISAWKAFVGTITTNIHNIKARIRRLSPEDEPTSVSDHAVLRYLQRVKGMDVDAIRSEIDTPTLRECIRNCPEGKFTLNGITYVVSHGSLVTVIYDGEDRT